MMNSTFIMLKPDASEKQLVKTILKELEMLGCEIQREKEVLIDEKLILAHYKEVIEKVDIKDFKQRVLNEYVGKTVTIAELTHPSADVISYVREQIGATEPISAKPGTIRAKYSDDSYSKSIQEERLVKNLIHASDSKETAKKELKLWFND